MTVSIVYGFAEGPWHGKKLRKSLKDSDIRLVNGVRESDVVIAHSGGCFMLPSNVKAKLIILVDPPYLDIHPLKEVINSVFHARIHKSWFIKFPVDGYYFITRISTWIKMNNNINKLNWPTTKSARVVIVRNYLDNFSDVKTLKKLAKDKGWAFKELPGAHEDIWNSTDSYVQLIKKYNSI